MVITESSYVGHLPMFHIEPQQKAADCDLYSGVDSHICFNAPLTSLVFSLAASYFPHFCTYIPYSSLEKNNDCDIHNEIGSLFGFCQVHPMQLPSGIYVCTIFTGHGF